MSEILGINIGEVWDYRLSTATPVLQNSGEFWRIEIHPKANGTGVPLETIQTDIPCEKGDARDPVKVAKCFNLILGVRDKYSLPNIEELKPRVAKINAKAAMLANALKGKTVAEGNVIVEKALKELSADIGE